MSDDLTGSALSHLECSRTGTTYDADVVQGVSEVGAPLLARYDLERVRDSVSPGDIAGREQTLWRYRELLPVRETANVVTLGEGMTPLLPLPAYGAAVGVPGPLMKDEGGCRRGRSRPGARPSVSAGPPRSPTGWSS
jgi:threonine synthase